MRALCISLTALLVVSYAGESWQKEYLNAGKDICRLFKNGVKLRKPGTCDTGIECQNFKSVDVTTCFGSTPFYKRTGSCAKTDSDTYCRAPCVKKSSGFVADSKSCKGWYKCNGATLVTRGNCESNLHFNATKQMCIYPENSSCNPTYEFCDVVPNATPFMDEFNCHKYYECSSRGLQSKQCPLGLYFDVSTASCTAKANVECYKHPYPDEVCGDTKIAFRNRFVPDGATCRGYFYCHDMGVGVPDKTPNWGQCPVSMFFSKKEESCLTRTHVKCEEDRCDGRTTGKELSETKGCQHYLVCRNNHTDLEVYCGPGMWFDTETETCTSVRKSYPVCA